MMNSDIPRRDFLKSVPPAAFAVSGAIPGRPGPTSSPRAEDPDASRRIVLEPFDYQGVELGESRWREQYRSAREYFAALSEDDILKGFRAAVGLPAPGETLGGWCAQNSNTVLGQWLSGMSRMYRATGDEAMREKARRLLREFAKTVRPDGNCGMRHYHYDKLVCGLVDLQLYGDVPEAGPLLAKVTDWSIRNLDRTNTPATPRLWWGRPNEWYTLGENLFRAFQLTGDSKYREFAEAWLYPQFWNKFAETSDPPDAGGLHAYSHCNTLSSAAMAYAVLQDPVYLDIIRNAYDFWQNRQCYATGGYGPIEHTMPSDGGLGRALAYRPDNFETICGSWAGFKLTRYLTQFTGEARYGDWMERLFYNGVGAALPITGRGKNYYYSDYRVAGGMKIYKRETNTCCAGTYPQAVADFHNLIYYKDESALYVNLYLSSRVTWTRPEGDVTLTQETDYPEEDRILLSLDLDQPANFSLKFRVPGWAEGVTAAVNGEPAGIDCVPGSWAEIHRTWGPGDTVEIRIPLRFRMQPVDAQHPNRVAIVRGPVVYVLDAFGHSQAFRLPDTDEELNGSLRPQEESGVFRLVGEGGRSLGYPLHPFYAMGEVQPYKMYFDREALPFRIW
jgi:DUF1680 family protein